MNSPLNKASRLLRITAFILVLSLLLIPGLAFGSYHGSYDLAPTPTPINPEGPGDFAPPPPPPPPPQPPQDLAPVPEVEVEPEEPEVAPEETEEEVVETTSEEEELDEEILVEAEEPEVEAEEVVTGVSQLNIWSILFFAVLFLFLIWVLFSRRRSKERTE